jgi:DNA-binding MarR family transcriptional regulator
VGGTLHTVASEKKKFETVAPSTGWADAAPEHEDAMWVLSSLMRANSLVLSNVERTVKAHGITFARYHVLAVLYFAEGGALTLSKLGQELLVHPTSVTSVVDKLEGDDLVRRNPHPTDRRTTYAQITRRGRALYRAIRPDLEADEYGVRGLTASDKRQLAALLRKLRGGIGDPRLAEEEDFLVAHSAASK